MRSGGDGQPAQPFVLPLTHARAPTPGEFGPFSRYIPVRQLNGIQYELLTYPEYERLKKAGKIKDKAFTVERPSVTGKEQQQAAKAAEKETVVVAEASAAVTVAEAAPVPSPSPPPVDPWKEATDPESGRSYWYNLGTGESSWTHP